MFWETHHTHTDTYIECVQRPISRSRACTVEKHIITEKVDEDFVTPFGEFLTYQIYIYRMHRNNLSLGIIKVTMC